VNRDYSAWMHNRTVILGVFFLLCSAGCSRKEPEQVLKPQVRDEGTLVVKEPEEVLKPWVPDEGTFAVKAPLAPQEQSLPMGAREYKFYSREKFAPLLLAITVQRRLKDIPGLPDSPPPDVFYDQYERAYRGARGEVINITTIKNGGYAGRQFEIPAGKWPPLVVRLFVAERRTYLLEWNPNVPHSTETADSFVIP
jgi:hypothetical protein